MNLIIRNILCLAYIFLLLNSCEFKIYEENNHKEENIEEAIIRINKLLIKAIKNEDKGLFDEISSSDLPNEKLDPITFLKKANILIVDSNYIEINKFDAKDKNGKLVDQNVFGINQKDGKLLTFKIKNNNNFTSVVLPQTKDSSWILVYFLNQYEGSWKINYLSMVQFRIKNKTAIDFYNDAKKYYEDGYLFDSYNTLGLCTKTLHPDPSWHYTKEKEIISFIRIAGNEFKQKYKFPITIHINSKPQIFDVFPNIVKDQFVPEIYYHTNLSLFDSASIKNENVLVHGQIEKTFYGIKRNNKKIVYCIYPSSDFSNDRSKAFIIEQDVK